VGEGGQAPPVDPDELDDDELDDEEYDDEEYEDDEPVRAEPWQPDASLMRALGLELAELQVRLEAGDADALDERPATSLRRLKPGGEEGGADGAVPVESDAELISPDEAAEAAEERPPWW
jgi:hypothetical protein